MVDVVRLLPNEVASALATTRNEINTSVLMEREKLYVHRCLDRLEMKLVLALGVSNQQQSHQGMDPSPPGPATHPTAVNPLSPFPVFPYPIQPNRFPVMCPAPPPRYPLQHPGMHLHQTNLLPTPFQPRPFQHTAEGERHQVGFDPQTQQLLGGGQKRLRETEPPQSPKQRQRTEGNQLPTERHPPERPDNSSIVWTEGMEIGDPSSANDSSANENSASLATDMQNEAAAEQQDGSSPNRSNNDDSRSTTNNSDELPASSAEATASPQTEACTTDNVEPIKVRMIEPTPGTIFKLRTKYTSVTEIAEDWYGLGSSAFAPYGGLMGLRSRKHTNKMLNQQLTKQSTQLTRMKKVAMCIALHIGQMRGTVDLNDMNSGFLQGFLARQRFPEPETFAAAKDVMEMVRDRFPDANTLYHLSQGLQQIGAFEPVYSGIRKRPPRTKPITVTTTTEIVIPQLRLQYSSILEIAEDWFGFGSSAFAPQGGILCLHKSCTGGSLFGRKNWSLREHRQIPYLRHVAACIAFQAGWKKGTIRKKDEHPAYLELLRFPEAEVRTVAQEITETIDRQFPSTKTLGALSDRLKELEFYAPCC